MTTPTAVLVHGALADASSYRPGTRGILECRDDSAAAVEAVAPVRGDAAVIKHSHRFLDNLTSAERRAVEAFYDMDLRNLEYFVAVAEEQSFTRAAQRCFVTQPTISSQVRALERELGEPLFDRGQRAVVLTDGGLLLLLPYARKCLRAVEDAKAEFSARAGLLRGELHIGSGGGVENTTIPGLLGALEQRCPSIDVDVDVSEATSGLLLEMVVQGIVRCSRARRWARIWASPVYKDCETPCVH
jgi:hypothetical protein